jgi:hypothetical protein
VIRELRGSANSTIISFLEKFARVEPAPERSAPLRLFCYGPCDQ